MKSSISFNFQDMYGWRNTIFLNYNCHCLHVCLTWNTYQAFTLCLLLHALFCLILREDNVNERHEPIKIDRSRECAEHYLRMRSHTANSERAMAASALECSIVYNKLHVARTPDCTDRVLSFWWLPSLEVTFSSTWLRLFALTLASRKKDDIQFRRWQGSSVF